MRDTSARKEKMGETDIPWSRSLVDKFPQSNSHLAKCRSFGQWLNQWENPDLDSNSDLVPAFWLKFRNFFYVKTHKKCGSFVLLHFFRISKNVALRLGLTWLRNYLKMIHLISIYCAWAVVIKKRTVRSELLYKHEDNGPIDFGWQG